MKHTEILRLCKLTIHRNSAILFFYRHNVILSLILHCVLLFQHNTRITILLRAKISEIFEMQKTDEILP